MVKVMTELVNYKNNEKLSDCQKHTASLLSTSPIDAESRGICSFSFTLASTLSIHRIISSKPSWTLMERVRVICSFSLRSPTDFERLS